MSAWASWSSIRSTSLRLSCLRAVLGRLRSAELFYEGVYQSPSLPAAVTKSLDAVMNGLGLTTQPKTRDEFKALVQGMDLTTEP